MLATSKFHHCDAIALQFHDLTLYDVLASNSVSLDDDLFYASVNDYIPSAGYDHGSATYKGKGQRIYMGAPSPLSGFQAAIADASTEYITTSPNPLTGSNDSWSDVEFQKATPNAYDMMRSTVLISAKLISGTGSFGYYTSGSAGRVSAEFQPASGAGVPTLIFKIDGRVIRRIPDSTATPPTTLTLPFEYIITEDAPITDLTCTSYIHCGGQAVVNFKSRATSDVQAFDSGNPTLPVIPGTPVPKPNDWPQGVPWNDPIIVESFQADPDDFPELDFTPLDEIEYEDYGDPI